MVFSAILGGVTSLIAGNKAAKESKRASRAQERLTREGMAQQREFFEKAEGYLQPYIERGYEYDDYYGDAYGLGGKEGQVLALERYKSNPSYALLQDVVGDATTNVKSTMAANGMLRSGAYGHELTQKIAPIVLQDYYNYQGGMDAGARRGQSAAGALAGYTTQQGAREAQGYSNIGQIQASGIVGANNARQQGYQNAMGY
ncbi:MAG: hypothetical protein AAF228_12135 [Pseudomonadota bacterium]